MTCKCIDEMNVELAHHNTRITELWQFSKPYTTVTIVTECVEKRRGKKAMLAVPTYCPFCGVKYDEAET